MSSAPGPAPIQPAPCGVNMTKCVKCGSSYNACLPGPHVCGPKPATSTTANVVKKSSDIGQINKKEVGPKGVNMAPCPRCGLKINRSLPPGSHKCSGGGGLKGPSFVGQDEIDDVDTDDLDLSDGSLNLELSDDDEKKDEKKKE